MEQIIKTKVHYYQFDISDHTDKQAYEKLYNRLRQDRKLMDVISLINYEQKTAWFNKIKALESAGVIELETKFIFNNQWNTTEKSYNLRVMDWSEEIYQNRNIKEGYYLDITEEMKEIRHNTARCGYCGKQYYKTKLTFCSDCLDNEYLKETDLFLLRILPIDNEESRALLTDKEKEILTQKYKNAQIHGNSVRGKARIKEHRLNLLKDKQKAIKDANREYKGFIWLLDHGINTKNCIYYNHVNLFCFGWRNKLGFETEQELKNQLKDFPFEYEIKV